MSYFDGRNIWWFLSYSLDHLCLGRPPRKVFMILATASVAAKGRGNFIRVVSDSLAQQHVQSKSFCKQSLDVATSSLSACARVSKPCCGDKLQQV